MLSTLRDRAVGLLGDDNRVIVLALARGYLLGAGVR